MDNSCERFRRWSLKSKAFDAHVFVGMGRAFVLIALGFNLYTSMRYKVQFFCRGFFVLIYSMF